MVLAQRLREISRLSHSATPKYAHESDGETGAAAAVSLTSEPTVASRATRRDDTSHLFFSYIPSHPSYRETVPQTRTEGRTADAKTISLLLRQGKQCFM
ncbi:hypothetical protein DPMN_008604 [Dreissena polymorpha]|uniref:Uncharacterized protein n=1 Tax=Dreissena polymorpha TaxID=45954 RepID=A0A9D4MZ34_DREPO|nr:hypothetical protein DPMN_008604 [Dreissena polymorpha]